MKALQMHYTSCRRGQSGHAGFQTRAVSSGLRPDEQREIERRSVYRPPRDVAPEPSAEEIAHNFPKALRFYRLDSGRWALTRSCYAGRDYSGRWGNFFAHTLVFENGHMPPLWPIDYFEWEGWQEKLEPEQDTEQMPTPLPLVDLGEIPPSDSFSIDELRDFLAEERGRPELLVRMVRAAFLTRETSRAVVIRDRPIQALYWIAAAQKLFPPAHALELSFSTYQDDPRGCAILNATTGETDFSFDEAERRYRFFIFDLTTGEHSEVPGEDNDYPQLAARWLVEEPQKLERFCEFMRLFNHRQLEPALVHAVHLFELSEGQENVLAGNGRVAAITGFASRHATPEGRLQLFEPIAEAGAKATGLLTMEDHACLVRFLAEGAEASGQPHDRYLAFRAWQASLRDLHGLHDGDLETIVASWNQLVERLAPYRKELAEHFLASGLGGTTRPRLTTLAPESLLFLLRLTWTCLEQTGCREPWAASEVEAIVDAAQHGRMLDKQLVHEILKVANDNDEALVAMVRKLSTPPHKAETDVLASCREVGRGLAGVLASIPEQRASTVRRLLDDEATWEVLFGEWLEISEQAREPSSAFKEYHRSVLDKLPGYGQQCRSWVASAILDRLPEKEQLPLLAEWISNAEIDRFPDDLYRHCLELANNALSLTTRTKNADEIATLVAAAATRRGIMLRPDRPLLRQVLNSLENTRCSIGELQLTAVRRALDGAETPEYEAFLAGFLVPALELVDNSKQHYQILRATLLPDGLAAYERSYTRFFAVKRKVAYPRSIAAALSLWSRFDSLDTETAFLSRLETTARRGLIGVLSKVGTESLKEIDRSVRKLRLNERQTRRWEEIQAGVEKRKQGPLAKLLSVFKFGT